MSARHGFAVGEESDYKPSIFSECNRLPGGEIKSVDAVLFADQQATTILREATQGKYALEACQFLPAPNIPHFKHVIEAAARQQVAVRRPRELAQRSGVARHLPNVLTAAPGPEIAPLEAAKVGLVVTMGGQQLPRASRIPLGDGLTRQIHVGDVETSFSATALL